MSKGSRAAAESTEGATLRMARWELGPRRWELGPRRGGTGADATRFLTRHTDIEKAAPTFQRELL